MQFYIMAILAVIYPILITTIATKSLWMKVSSPWIYLLMSTIFIYLIYIALYSVFDEPNYFIRATDKTVADKVTLWDSLSIFFKIHSKQLKVMATTFVLSFPILGVLFYIFRK